MRSFEYAAPTSIDEAVALLTAHGERARPLAGGTDLLVQMRRDLLAPQLLVDVKRIPDLNCISFSPDAGLTIGAAVPLALLSEHPDVARHYPGLVDAVSLIGGTAIQGRATLGGNLCNAAPSADSIPALIVLGASCTIAGPQGLRSLPVEYYCTGPGQTVLGRGELLVAVHVPPPRAGTGAHYLRFTPRNEMDIAVVGVAASVVLSPAGPAGADVMSSPDRATVATARIALGAVGPTPILAEAAGASLAGRAPSEEALAEAAALAQRAARPIDDVRGTAAQRRHLVGVLTRRALREAVRRAVSS